jgi:ADP-ribose pyrophosphatase YjhB (NUDIX family)
MNFDPTLVHVDQTETDVITTAPYEYVTTVAPPSLSAEDLQDADISKVKDELNFEPFIDQYEPVLDSIVVKCTDFAVVNEKNQVLIGTRNAEPQPGDWVCGGRKRAGESNADSARRILSRELKIPELRDLETPLPDGMRKVGHYDFVWHSRQQPTTIKDDGSQIKGCHTASDLMLFPVSSEQIDTKNFDTAEYANLRWADPLEIIDAPTGEYHPCLVDMMRDTIEALTQPEVPTSAEEDKLRTLGTIATLQSHLRQLDK